MNKMPKSFIIICLFFIEACSIFALPITVSKVNLIPAEENIVLTTADAEVTTLLFQAIEKADKKHLLTIERLPDSAADKEIKSNIDAAETCELLNIPYLFYGYIEKTNGGYNAVFQLYEQDTQQDIKGIYANNGLEKLNGLINEISDKLVAFAYKMVETSQIQPESENKQSLGGFGFTGGAGYWDTIGNWNATIQGLFNIKLGTFFTAAPAPAKKAKNFAFYPRFGIDALYDMGINKPNYSQYTLHSLLFGLPINACLEFFENNVVTIGAGPQLQMDIFTQTKSSKIYSELHNNFSLFSTIGYEYWFGKDKIAAIGVNGRFNFTFYSDSFLSYEVIVYSNIRIPSAAKP